MSRTVLVWISVLVVAACGGTKPRAANKALAYPTTRTVEHVDEYHGTKVADPYRWLEDDNSEETKAWVAEQNKLTFGYLEQIGRARERIKERISSLINYERTMVPKARGGRYFFERNDGLQEQNVLYWSDGLDGEPQLLLDPNTLSEGGTISLAGYFPSPDGKLLAYALSHGGSDWREILVRDVETGKDFGADRLEWIKFSAPSWKPDGSGFTYARMPKPEPGKEMTALTRKQKVYFHEVGRPQAHDVLLYDRADQPDWFLGPWLSEDGRYLMIYVSPKGSRNNGIFFKDLEADGPVVEGLKDFDANYSPLANDGTVWWMLTNKDAPLQKIVKIDLADAAPEKWETIVPEAANSIEDAVIVGDRILVHYLRRAHSQLKVFNLDGTFDREIELPARGSIYSLSGRRKDREAFFDFMSFTVPRRVYRYDLDKSELELWKKSEVDVDPDDFVVEQVVYSSRDGERVTMFLAHKKGIELDGSNPTLLYGYGGFNSSQTPRYSTRNVVWMEMGGVYALANLRGGGEYGRHWYEGGVRENKQNVFDDFISAAEALVHNGYTRSDKLAIAGGSNGGLLVGACMTQRPELFGACLPAVGVMDMLRFHKFTAGAGWIGDYGSSDDPDMFKVLLAYSPYHNLRAGVAYPATLVTTADHDDRVVPAHSFKFAARLQAYQGGNAPVLIRVETQAGHGAGTALSKYIEVASDRLAFLAKNLDIEVSRRFWR